jgi:hypothetical protein
MKVAQIYNLVNTMYGEIVGGETIVAEDLSNVVDIGREIFDATSVDKFVNKLVDHIGRLVIVERPYQGTAPSLLMDSWEYGSVKEKITMHRLPVAESNESWNLVDGQVYEQDTFNQPDVMVTFFDKYITFEVTLSIADKQVKSAFDSASQVNAFFSMIETMIYNSRTVKTDELAMRVINQMIGATINADFPGGTGYDTGSTVRCVNLLKLYNDANPSERITTFDGAISSGSFIRFASYTMARYEYRMRRLSRLFNIGAQARFTPADRLHFVMLNDFAKAAGVYNQSDTFHDEFTALPNAELVPYWQGTGTDYGYEDMTSINVTLSGATPAPEVEATGIIGVMFDRDALGICNERNYVTTHYNARAEFTNLWYKSETGLWCDYDEPFVVFYANDSRE